MLKKSRLQPLLVALVVGIIGSASPAAAQSVIVIERRNSRHLHNQPTVGNFIYGSPISTPIPVDPLTGHTPNRSYSVYSREQRYPRRYRSTINPILINPTIRDSVLVNPVIVESGRFHGRQRRYAPRSRILIDSRW